MPPPGRLARAERDAPIDVGKPPSADFTSTVVESPPFARSWLSSTNPNASFTATFRDGLLGLGRLRITGAGLPSQRGCAPQSPPPPQASAQFRPDALVATRHPHLALGLGSGRGSHQEALPSSSAIRR